MGLSAVNVNNIDTNIQPVAGVADRSVTVNDTSGGVAMIVAALNANTTHVMWTLDGADARFTLDNSAPTSSNGHWVSDKSSGIWHRNTAAAAKWIRAASTDAYLHISEVTH